MFGRLFSVRGVWMPVLASTMLFTASILAAHTAGHASVGAAVMSQSRGSNQNNVIGQGSCNANNGNAPCTVIGNPCVSCSIQFYPFPVGGSNGGYQLGGVSKCGSNVSGTCDQNLFCDTSKGAVVGICANATNVIIQP
jgi:hypothetical protein